MEFRGHEGVMHFGISEGIGGLKYGSRPLVGTDIFWNRPIGTLVKTRLFSFEGCDFSNRVIL